MNELIRKAKSGDPEAFIHLIEANKRSLYRVAKGYFWNEMDVEDAMADAVTACWERLDTLRKSEYFKTWLIRILINTCNDMLRARRNVVPLDSLAEMTAPDSDPAGRTYDDMLDMLDDKYRVVLILYYGEGFKAREIGEILDLPVGTVTSRLKRGREQLAVILEERGALA